MAFVVVATIVLVAANVAAETVLLIAVPGIPVKLVPVNVGIVEYESVPDPLFINTPVALAREPKLVTLVGILDNPDHGTLVRPEPEPEKLVLAVITVPEIVVVAATEVGVIAPKPTVKDGVVVLFAQVAVIPLFATAVETAVTVPTPAI